MAVVLYLAYASFVVLNAVCMLCVGTYVAIIGLFLLSGSATRYPMTSLPSRAAKDFKHVVSHARGVVRRDCVCRRGDRRCRDVPGRVGHRRRRARSGDRGTGDQWRFRRVPPVRVQQLEEYLAQQPRVPIIVPSDGAAVVIVKFNDYQCPPCRQTFMEYKPVFAKWAHDAPGKVKFMTRDYPLETQCNQFVQQDLHPSSCEAAVAVRLAKEKGKGEAMEEWVFANQPSLTPELVKNAVRTVAGVTDFDARFPDDARNW